MITMLIPLLLVFFATSILADELIPARRKDQYPTSPAHLVVPLPYSLPGIGDGMMLLAHLSKTTWTRAAVFA